MKKIFYVFLFGLAFVGIFASSNTLEIKDHLEARSAGVGLGDYTTHHYELHWDRFWNYLKALPAKARETLERAPNKR